MLRREGYSGRIVMVSADSSAPYDRPNLSKDYLAGNAPEEWIPLRSPEFYRERGIELYLGARAVAINRADRHLQLEDGSRYSYDTLLMATGADPVRLPVPGSDLPHVHYLRSPTAKPSSSRRRRRAPLLSARGLSGSKLQPRCARGNSRCT
jgi:apoptosis-inducing factor 3